MVRGLVMVGSKYLRGGMQEGTETHERRDRDTKGAFSNGGEEVGRRAPACAAEAAAGRD